MIDDQGDSFGRRTMLGLSGSALGLLVAARLSAAPPTQPPKQIWYPNYQERDRAIIDYQEFQVPGCDVKFRGPGFDPFTVEQGSFFTCIGAAQTYGCFYPKPFPTLLAESIGLRALNLGVGGAGPGFYGQYDSLIQAINRGRFLVLQCMAARHESNSRFAADGYVEFLRDRRTGEQVNSGIAWKRIVDEEPRNALRYVAESRASWIETSRKLLDRIKVPVIFFWYSRRQADYRVDRAEIEAQRIARMQGKDNSHYVRGLSGDFPHYVDDWTAGAVADMCTAKAECFSSRGMNQPIISQITGKPIGRTMPNASAEWRARNPEMMAASDGVNHYYPSPEMHIDARDALLPVAKRFLA